MSSGKMGRGLECLSGCGSCLSVAQVGNGSIRLALSESGSGEMPPSNVHALHSCDVRLCCNPAHLRWGTHQENMRDRAERHPSYSWIETEVAARALSRILQGESRPKVARETGIGYSSLRFWAEAKSRPEILARARELAGQESQAEQLSLF